MSLQLRVDDSLAAALAGRAGDVPAAGLVFAPARDVPGWDEALAELQECFRLTRDAATRGDPVVYVVSHDDLLGRRGALGAMLAAGLVSAARSLALETRKSGVPVNVVATTAGTEPGTTARWVLRLLAESGDGVTGEVVRLGGDHLGKVVP